jgi:hypothetical protein
MTKTPPQPAEQRRRPGRPWSSATKAEVFDETIRALTHDFKYARYTPLTYYTGERDAYEVQSVFRRDSTGDSGRIRPAIPAPFDHPFRKHPTTDSGVIRPVVPA